MERSKASKKTSGKAASETEVGTTSDLENDLRMKMVSKTTFKLR